MRKQTMSKLASLALAVAALAVAAGTASADEWSKVRIGVEGAYPPFSWVDPDGTLKGFDIDITDALCNEMGAECEMVQQDLGRHHPGAAGPQVRRHCRLDVDYR